MYATYSSTCASDKELFLTMTSSPTISVSSSAFLASNWYMALYRWKPARSAEDKIREQLLTNTNLKRRGKEGGRSGVTDISN